MTTPILLLAVTQLAVAQQGTAPVPRRDATLERARLTEPSYADPATRRLTVLTEIWGNIGLYHPVPFARRMKWDDVLIAALREMPGVRSDRDFVALLNRVVFAPLDDPLTFAIHRADASPPAHRPNATQWLTPGTLYIDASAQPWQDVQKFGVMLDSLERVQHINQLVFDLRYENRPSFWLTPPFGQWIREPILLGAGLSLLQTTENNTAQPQWLLYPRDSMQPVSRVVASPTVFVVNRTSYPLLERGLDAVRSHRSDVAVVFEQTGAVNNIGDFTRTAWYPDSIILSHTRLPIVSADGGLGSIVDINTPGVIPLAGLARIADSAMALRHAQLPRTPFQFAAGGIRDDSVSLGPLTREQRLAGLLKFWFWIKTFYAYPDDITGDWRSALATWVPRVEAAQSDSAYYRVLLRMAALLNDTHLQIRHPLAGMRGLGRLSSPPLQVNWVERRLIVTRVDTVTSDIGVSVGDEITSINGVSVADLVVEERQYWSFSTPYGAELPPFTFMSGPRGSTMRLGVGTPAGQREVTLARSRPAVSTILTKSIAHPAFAILPGNLGFIDLTQMRSLEQFDSVMTHLASTRGLLLDRRGPAQSDFGEFLPWFITDPAPWLRRIWSVSYTSSSGEFPIGAYGAQEAWTVPSWPADAPVSKPNVYSKPVVLLTGDNVSHGESLAAWFRLSKRATLVGAPTEGTQYSADWFTLPGGAEVQFTRVRIVWPDGQTFHRVGVQPDMLVRPTIRGVRAGRDEVYDAGLATLRKLVGQ